MSTEFKLIKMELVDENEGYYDEEDDAGVVDFMQGEQLPTFSLGALKPDQQNNERAKQYSQVPSAETGTAEAAVKPKLVTVEKQASPVADLRQVLNDPYLR